MKQVQVIGMSCQHCVAATKKALEGLGLQDVQVDLEAGVARFQSTDGVSEAQIREALDDAGFDMGAVE